MSAKRQIMKKFMCSESLYDRARQLWLQENAAHCLLLGIRFENMHWDTIGKYIEQATN